MLERMAKLYLKKEKNTDINKAGSIFFYDSDQPFYFLTNFFMGAPITIKNTVYKTPEHYYQSEKFTDPVIKQRIINTGSADLAAQVANQNKSLIIPHFDKLAVMKEALWAKFTQYKDLGQALIDTGDRQLVEHNIQDEYWADGGDGSGYNHFGKLLMEIRDDLK